MDEPHLPYQRHPFSKAFLAGEVTIDQLLARSAAAYEKAHISVSRDVRVESVDRAGRTFSLAGGETVRYNTLVLATGSSGSTILNLADGTSITLLDVASLKSTSIV